MHVKELLLFTNDSTWMKRSKHFSFDVTMGSFDGAEVCELVGLYILNLLGSKFGKKISGCIRMTVQLASVVLTDPLPTRFKKILV